MKNLKKVLALVVALTMVFTTVAFASYPDVDANADYAGAVELLSALDILKGDDAGNFNPDNTITRAEFAAVVCRALGLEGSANGAKGATMFTDVAADHWASGYVNLASQQGIVNGKGNGIFDPEGNVTFTEAVKMLVVALGYEPMAAQRGGWPTGYLTVANSTKMTAGVSASGTDAAALRSTVAQLTANAIEIPVMDQTSFGTETKYEPMDDYGNYKTLLTSRDVYIVTGVVLSVDEVEGEFVFKFSAYPEDYEFGYLSNGNTDGVLIGKEETFDVADSNVADYIGQNVDVYLSKVNRSDYEALIAVPSGIGETLELTTEDIDWAAQRVIDDKGTEVDKTQIDTANDFDIEYYETKDANKTTKLYIAKNPTIKVNGVITTKVTNLDAFQNSFASIKFTENNNNKYYDIIDITVYEHKIVEEVEADKERILFADGEKVVLTTDDDEIVNIYNAEGAKIAISDIVAGDVVAMVVGDLKDNEIDPKDAKNFATKITLYNLGQSSVTGAATGWAADDKELVIDGATYEYVELWVTDESWKDFEEKGCVGSEGTFYLGINGKIIGFDGTKGVNGTYGFILQIAPSTQGFDDQLQIKMLTTEGVVVYNVDIDCDIDNTQCDTLAKQATALGLDSNDKLAKYTKNDANDAYKRVVDYDVNKNGEIDEISFVYANKHNKNAFTNIQPGDAINVNGEYSVTSTSYKVNSKKITEQTIIFDVTNSDSDDSTVIDLTSLIDEGEYKGTVLKLDSNNEYDIFVMTEGNAAFNGEANFFVVDSKADIKYDDDDAVQITYYTAGEEAKLTAIFNDDSDSTYGDYKNLTKGSIFVATVAEDGHVSDYAVLATMITTGANAGMYDVSGLQDAVKAAYDVENSVDEGVEYIAGSISAIDKNEITVAGRVVDVAGAAQYAYNTNGSKAKISVGEWDPDNVDEPADGKANIAIVKLFDGEVTDIITTTARFTSGNIAESTPSYNNGGSLQSVAEKAEVVDVVEDIVVEDVIDFE